jgi:ABC-type Mn2+/Zn2+ transport system permease subunit
VIFFRELATSALLRRAVMEAVGVGAICGALGAHVVLRRLSFFTVTISHATFPGVVIASILGASLFLGGAVTALAVVVAVGIVGSQRRLDSSTATGVVLAGAFALGVLLLSAQPRAATDLTSFLVGSLLTVSDGDLVLTAVVAAVVVAVMSALHKELVLGAFDREGAEALGFRPLWLDLAVLTLVAITVVTAVPAVGTILVVALLVTPALTARLWTERIGSMMLLGAALGALSGFVGLWVATQARIAAGASVVLVSSALLALSLVARGAHRIASRPRPMYVT